GMVFQSLGHMAHHIQDMAQPQHVRNERHTHFELSLFSGPTIAYITTAPARYEEQTYRRWLTIAAQLPNYPTIPVFPRAKEYWISMGSGSGYSGMADFTAKNYV